MKIKRKLVLAGLQVFKITDDYSAVNPVWKFLTAVLHEVALSGK